MVPIERLLAEAGRSLHRNARPLVTLSYAQSLDGCIAARQGEPLTLSGAESMRMTHQLRAGHDAILVGIGTVLADNPRLTVRLAPGKSPQPVILDSRLRLPLNSNLLHHPPSPWIAAGEDVDPQRQVQLEDRGGRVFYLPVDESGHLSLPALLSYLSEQGVNSLMVEGGATVIGSFLEQRLVDLLVLTIAPIFVGGLHPFDVKPANWLLGSSFPNLREIGSERLGDDLVVWGKLDARPL